VTESPVTENQTEPQDESADDAQEVAPTDAPEQGITEETVEATAADEGQGGDAPRSEARSAMTKAERLEQEGEIAADYLEELLEIADLDGDLDMDVEGDRATVSIVGADLPQLVGDNGEVLEALQELTRLAVYRETGERSRLMLDVSGHRAARRQALEERAVAVVAQVKDSGQSVSLEPMSPFERKVVHDAVAAAGLTSESEGVEPRRFVVVLPPA
jgi:spoIIIJ-associated protein